MLQNDVWRVTAKMRGDDNVSIQNVYHYTKTDAGAVSQASAQADIAAELDAAYAAYAANINNAVTAEEIEFFDVTNGAPLPTQSWNTFTAGTGSVGPVPSGVAPLLLFRTGASRVLGRKFLPQCDVSNTFAGDMDSSALVDMLALAVRLATIFTGVASGADFVTGVLGAGNILYEIIEVVARSEPAYQRRRRAGSGI